MYWLWKWLESYNNCICSTWKDKCLFNLLFWIPNLFCTFHDYGRGAFPPLPLLTARHCFLSFKILNNLRLPWKQSCPELFHCVEIFLSFRIFEQIVLALKNRVSPENFHCIKVFLFLRIFEQFALALKTECALNIFTVLNLLFPFKIFEQLTLTLINRVCPEFTVLKIYFLSFRIFSNLRLSWKTEFALKLFLHWNIFYLSGYLSNLRWLWNRVCPEIFNCIEIFSIFHDFWATCACPKNRVIPENFKPGGGRPRVVSHWRPSQ